jgi:hypothetical protein
MIWQSLMNLTFPATELHGQEIPIHFDGPLSEVQLRTVCASDSETAEIIQLKGPIIRGQKSEGGLF